MIDQGKKEPELEDDGKYDDDDRIAQQAELVATMRENGTSEDTQMAALAITKGCFQRNRFKPGG